MVNETSPDQSAGENRPMVRAAGGVVTRAQDGTRVLVVHRPRYDDWSFPKGKRDEGETDQQCAVREVREETGLVCVLGRELAPVLYFDRKGRPKVVRYFEMVASEADGVAFTANDEVDEIRWLTAAEARALLTYPRDRTLLDSLGPR